MPGRTAKQCRERYNNHVDPGIKKDKIWTAEEDALVMQLHAEHHNQFAKIARNIPGRCYDDVKNRRVRYNEVCMLFLRAATAYLTVVVSRRPLGAVLVGAAVV